MIKNLISPSVTPPPNAEGARTYEIRTRGRQCIATATTEAEAELACRLLDQAFLPRLTRYEAIALVLAALTDDDLHVDRRAIDRGAQLALTALADAGVFSDGRNMADRLDRAGIR